MGSEQEKIEKMIDPFDILAYTSILLTYIEDVSTVHCSGGDGPILECQVMVISAFGVLFLSHSQWGQRFKDRHLKGFVQVSRPQVLYWIGDFLFTNKRP